MPRQRSSSRQARSSVRDRSDVTGAPARAVTSAPDRGEGPPRPLWYRRRRACRPASRGAQRHRRNGAARRGRGGGSAARSAALAIPLLLFGSFLALGTVGFVTRGQRLRLLQPATCRTRRRRSRTSASTSRRSSTTGPATVELARLGERKRELVTFDEIPPEILDATTAIEDKDFWTNPGFDLGGFISAALDTLQGKPRGGSTITQQLVRARLLPAEAFEGSVYERKIREIIQSIRLTQAYPGEEGKEKIITAYLNQNFYGNQSYGIAAAVEGLLRQDAGGADPRPGRDPGGHPPVADRVRPGHATRPASAPSCPPTATTARPTSVRLVVPQDSAAIVRAQPGSSTS